MVNYEIQGETSVFSILKIDLDPDEEFYCEPAAFVSSSDNIRVSTKSGMGGEGFLGGIKRTFAGESFYTLKLENLSKKKGEIILSPNKIGEIIAIDLEDYDNEIVVKQGSYFCHINRDIPVKLEIFSPTGRTFINARYMTKISGNGLVFISADGNSLEKELKEGERLIVDSKNILSLEMTLNAEIVYKDVKTTLFGGEASLLRLTGPGQLRLNSHNTIDIIDSRINRLKSS